jgi:hypothetical protein
MDGKEAKFILSYMAVAKELKKDPNNAIKYITQNRNLFNFTDKQIEELKKAAEERERVEKEKKSKRS